MIKEKGRKIYFKVKDFVKAKPLTSFFAVLLLLLALMFAGNFLSPQKETIQKPELIKNVRIYKVGKNPTITLQAKIEKSGVIKITALAPGVIQSINFYEGDKVNKGQILINMSSNYQGGSVPSIQRQLAQKQYQNAKDTLDAQKDLINTQKTLAEKSEENLGQIRKITDQSLQETRDLINLNQSIVDTLSQNQTTLEQSNTGGVNDAAILQIKSQKAAVQAGLNQLRNGLRQAEFQASGDKPPAELGKLQKDIALKQLDLQKKALDLGLEVNRLQLVLAQISEALYFPASPFGATVQRVHVKEGQAVNPGTPLMTLSATDDPITAVINLPQNLAGSVSTVLPTTLYINDQEVQINPHFISTEATEGMLHSIIYMIPDKFSKDLTENGYIKADIPAGLQAEQSVPFVPLDSVYQNANESIVLVVANDRAESRIIKLGNVFGQFVEIKSGLSKDDRIILNRNILAGDKVSIQE
ncbi:HlyD family efflux transporter periplasmic adaptor subunit [Candidatus Daviesbacteria bacterium]|nr:HlyD family efflux transporter periplasmic adaptor subunit [Candidatus Daviesbacteria bacterium]